MGQAIVVRDLWERYRVLEDKAGGVKEVLSRFRIARSKKIFWALKGVSFEVQAGETVGLIGSNGSGKSTLLKCLAGIIPATQGTVLVGGTVSSLIELGAGFHGELTGRENAMVVGTLFGMTRRQVVEKMDSIISFAELHEAMDHPYRTYSSGMQVRLSFSLAIHVEPDILLVDEVLAVGDESFQRKCVKRVKELGEKGVTIVFVSHDLQLVRRICDRSLLLHDGKVAADGPTSQVIDEYLSLEGIEEESPTP